MKIKQIFKKNNQDKFLFRMEVKLLRRIQFFYFLTMIGSIFFCAHVFMFKSFTIQDEIANKALNNIYFFVFVVVIIILILIILLIIQMRYSLNYFVNSIEFKKDYVDSSKSRKRIYKVVYAHMTYYLFLPSVVATLMSYPTIIVVYLNVISDLNRSLNKLSYYGALFVFVPIVVYTIIFSLMSFIVLQKIVKNNNLKSNYEEM